MMKRNYRCGECGSTNMKLSNVKGSHFPYKSYLKVVITVDIELYQCQDCSNIILTNNDCSKLDKALEDSIAKLK